MTLVGAFLWLLLTIGVLVIAAYLQSVRKPVKADGRVTYEKVKPLSDPEQMLYTRLGEALPECLVLPQVSFSRFMKPVTDGKLPLPQYSSLHDSLDRKSIDYLICLRDFTIVAAIELDDAWHHCARDERRDLLLEAAGIRVLKMKLSDMPSVEQIRTQFTHPGSELPAYS